MDDHVLELIHREIDGINSPTEQQELHDLIAADGDAKSLYNDLFSTVHALERVEFHEPPLRLKQAIMSALPANRYAPARPRAAFEWRDAARRLLQIRPRLGYAYTFAVGLVAGLALVGVWGSVMPDASSTVYGTLISRDAVASMQPVEDVQINIDGVDGTVRVQAGDQQALLELSLDTRHPVEVHVAFDDARLPLRGLTRLDDEPGAMLSTEPGLVKLAAHGRHSYLFAFDNRVAGTKLHLQILQNGQVRFQEDLSTQTP